MAQADSSFSYKILNPFLVCISKIGQELTSIDVKVVQSVLIDKISREDLNAIDINKPNSGVTLVSVLHKYRHLSRNNLGLLKELLRFSKRFDLLKVLEKFEETVTELDDATKAQMDTLPAPMSVNLYLVVTCKSESLSVRQIDKLKEAIKGASGLNLSNTHTVHVSYISSRENERDKETTIVTFQFHENSDNHKTFTENLTSSAMKKEAWLIENDVIMLKVNDHSSVNIKENVEFKPKDAEDESIKLVNNPHLQVHLRNVVDVILVVEMSYSMNPNSCKRLLKECQSAIQMLSETAIGPEKLDMNVAVIQFGNHSASSSSPQPTAIVVQDFCKEYDVMSKLKRKGRCGGKNGGNSGMSDALAKVVELAQGSSMRAEASKVCVLINFLSKNSNELEHYRCNHGNDVIKLANTIADHEIPLYIIGIDGNEQMQENLCSFEECLLSGVCHIGGGRFLPILKNEIQGVNQMISSAIKGDVSIENHGEITGEVFKDALNNHFGDPNVSQLANDVENDLRIKPLKFEKLLQNGRSLEPITQAVERVAFADDLNDAIGALERMKDHDPDHNLGIGRGVRCSHMGDYVAHSAAGTDCILSGKGGETLVDFLKGTYSGIADVAKSPRKSLERGTIEEGHHSVDLEMASRIVRRHMHRMAYYKKKP